MTMYRNLFHKGESIWDFLCSKYMLRTSVTTFSTPSLMIYQRFSVTVSYAAVSHNMPLLLH